MERSPAFLAALASAAIPQLDPVSVQGLPSLPSQEFDVAFVEDSDHRRWVVRAPRTEVASARMEAVVPLLTGLSRRLPFAVPTPKAFIGLKGGGRAVVYPMVVGHPVDLSALHPGPGLAGELGRAIAAIHDLDHHIYDDAGVPSYDTDAYRSRRFSELDRAARVGNVPASLMARWEEALEDVALWRFAPVPTHGDLTGEVILVVVADEDDPGTVRIRAVTGWEDAKIADPADDFAALIDQASPDAAESVFDAYSRARHEQPDSGLLARARLAGELRVVADLGDATTGGDAPRADVLQTQLHRLADAVELGHAPALRALSLGRRRPVVIDSPTEVIPALPALTTSAAFSGTAAHAAAEAVGDPDPDLPRVLDTDLVRDGELTRTADGAAFTGVAVEESDEGRSEVTYRDGLPDGPAVDWLPSGQRKSSSTFSRGVAHGASHEYDPSGRVTAVAWYEQGIFVRRERYAEDGAVLDTAELDPSTGAPGRLEDLSEEPED